MSLKNKYVLTVLQRNYFSGLLLKEVHDLLNFEFTKNPTHALFFDSYDDAFNCIFENKLEGLVIPVQLSELLQKD